MQFSLISSDISWFFIHYVSFIDDIEHFQLYFYNIALLLSV